jgi:hypothetical protein
MERITHNIIKMQNKTGETSNIIDDKDDSSTNQMSNLKTDGEISSELKSDKLMSSDSMVYELNSITLPSLIKFLSQEWESWINYSYCPLLYCTYYVHYVFTVLYKLYLLLKKA